MKPESSVSTSVLDPQSGEFQPDPLRVLKLLAANLNYQPTPVLEFGRECRLPGKLLIKDERQRFGMTSFKAAGGIYAVFSLVAKRWEARNGNWLQPGDFRNSRVRQFAASMTFVCASAGNHGLAVTRGAKLTGARARIHLSATVPESFAEKLRADGAEVVRSGENYEESMQASRQDADASGGVLIADASWDHYLEPPALVMEGYTILADELQRSFERVGHWPTRVYLQAGVGGLAAAIAFIIRKYWPVQPEIILVEPEAAPCLKDSIGAGELLRVEGPVSNMGRLDCKVPSLLAMQVLASAVDRFMLVSDAQATDVMAELDRLGVATTPSGAAGYAALCNDAIKTVENDRTLIFVTEAAI